MQKLKIAYLFVSDIPKTVKKNKIGDNCYNDDDDDSIIYSPEKPISINSNNVSKTCIQVFLY